MTAESQHEARVVFPCTTVGVITRDGTLTGLHLLPANTPALAPKKNSIAHLVCVQLMAYLDNPRYEFDLPIRLSGSKHQLDVWHAMQTIPSGQTQQYGELAHAVGSNARAVGTACGQNPIPIVVPCHRVVAANGLGGFMGGKRDDPLAIKRWLLTHERAWPETPGLF